MEREIFDDPNNGLADELRPSAPEPKGEEDHAEEDKGEPREERRSAPRGESDVEERARRMGWRPKEEWEGDPEKHRSAEEFVQRGEEMLPIVRSRAERAEREASEARQRIEAMEQDYADRFARMERMSAIALQRQKQQIEARYADKMRSAVEYGDVETYDRLARQQQDELREFDAGAEKERETRRTEPERKQRQEPQEMPLTRQQQATVDEWMSDNPWWQVDQVLQNVALSEHRRLLQQYPGMGLRENLSRVSNYVRNKFPEKFGDDDERDEYETGEPRGRGSRGRGVTAVESGSRRSPSRSDFGVSRLPAEARAEGLKFVEQGLFKDLNDYAKEYFGQ